MTRLITTLILTITFACAAGSPTTDPDGGPDGAPSDCRLFCEWAEDAIGTSGGLPQSYEGDERPCVDKCEQVWGPCATAPLWPECQLIERCEDYCEWSHGVTGVSVEGCIVECRAEDCADCCATTPTWPGCDPT